MAQAMSVNEPGYMLSARKLEQRVDDICNRLIKQELEQIMKNLHDVSQRWSHDIETKSEAIKDIFQNGVINKPPHVIFSLFFKFYEEKTAEIRQEVSKVLQTLRWHINRWKTHQLHDCVKRRLEGEPENTAYVEKLCEKVCGMVRLLLDCWKTDLTKAYKLRAQTSTSTIPAPIPASPITKALQEILKELVTECFVVIDQPQLTMMFEKEKKDKDDSNNSKKFDTTVGLLGGKALEDYIEIRDMDIILVFQGDLAKNMENMPHAKICSDKGRLGHSSRSIDTPDLSYQRKYEKLRVEGFNRKETRTNVYKQLYRVVYTAHVAFKVAQKENEIPAKVISLPVIMRTGANQASEHVGALLWHSFSSINVHDLQAGMVTSMSIDSCIQMINERILFIGGRGLKPYERQFLHDRLSVMAASGRKKNSDITLDSFVKDKVELATNNTGEKHTRPFTLWLWLHSIFNLLQETLREPWIDGVIYGIVSREHCIKVLEDPNVSDGTFLLRFSESYRPGNYMMCKGGIALVLKLNGKARFVPPIQAETIEREGLAHTIEQTGCQRELSTGRHISDLRRSYPPTVQDPQNTVFVKERYPEFDESLPQRPILRATKRSGDKPYSPDSNKMSCSSPPQSPESGVWTPASSPSRCFPLNGAHDQLTSSLRSPDPTASHHIGSPDSASLRMESPVSSGLPVGPAVTCSFPMGPAVTSSLPMGSAVFSCLPMGSSVSSGLQLGSAAPSSIHMMSPESCNIRRGSPASPSSLPVLMGAVPTTLSSGFPSDMDFDEQELQGLCINSLLTSSELEQALSMEPEEPSYSHCPATSQACGNFLVSSNDPVMTVQPL